MPNDIYFGNNTVKNMTKMIFSLSGYVKAGSSSTKYYFKTSEDSSYFTGSSTETNAYYMTKVKEGDFYCRFVGDLQITKKKTDTGDSGGWISIDGPGFYSDDANYEQKLRDVKRSGWDYNIIDSSGRSKVNVFKHPVLINGTKNQWTNPFFTNDILIPSWFTEISFQFATNSDLAASFCVLCMLAE